MENHQKDLDLLDEARRVWEAMDAFRSERKRCKRYCYGDQWGDPVWVDGKWMREDSYIRSLGSEPLKNNLIRRLVKQVLGLYRSERKPIDVQASEKWMVKHLANALQRVENANAADELNARALEEFLVSGMVAQRKTFGWRMGRNDCWTDNVPLDHFFIDALMGDTRGWGVSLVGQMLDMRFDALCAEFAHDPTEMEWLAHVYDAESFNRRLDHLQTLLGMPPRADNAFFAPLDQRLCRVYEVWRRERRPGYICHNRHDATMEWIAAGEAMQRMGEPGIDMQWQMKEQWNCFYLSPFGDILGMEPSPYAHGSHPFVFKGYPLVDGEIHSFVADIIDQQRYTNRLITLYDWVMRSSAKGVLLVPEEALAEGYTVEDVAREWARFNGVIPVRTRNGAMMPQQVAANAVNVGINELLQTQLNFMEDISGVTRALQGKMMSASVSGKLFEQQTQNATLSQLDLLDTFRNFIKEGAEKDVSNILQFMPDDILAPGASNEQVMQIRKTQFFLR